MHTFTKNHIQENVHISFIQNGPQTGSISNVHWQLKGWIHGCMVAVHSRAPHNQNEHTTTTATHNYSYIPHRRISLSTRQQTLKACLLDIPLIESSRGKCRSLPCGRSRVTHKGILEVLWCSGMFCALVWAVVTQVCWPCENSLSSTLLFVLYFSTCMLFFHKMYKMKGKKLER